MSDEDPNSSSELYSKERRTYGTPKGAPLFEGPSPMSLGQGSQPEQRRGEETDEDNDEDERRRRSLGGGPTRWDCLGKSVLAGQFATPGRGLEAQQTGRNALCSSVEEETKREFVPLGQRIEEIIAHYCRK
jgi:hypothetical protein